ncbi:spore coat protein U domain-containing protein [Lysobacter sp. F6437]|uniref:spore coat protein U domain-containing protein n=1 Tax=Lysobacter sp. F6437 TaxID=3459296 RepID=UPI00403DD264
MNMLKTSLLATALIAAGISSANAATKTANFGVQLVVQNSCTITAGEGVADMDFGSVTGNIAANIDSSTDLTVNCNEGAEYSIALNDGANDSANQRRMTNGTQFVNYNLFSDETRTAAWGNGTEVSRVGTNADETITVYGRVPAGQSVGAGTYNDTVTATIEF